MRSDGIRYCKFCDDHYLGGWCPSCSEKDARHEIRVDSQGKRPDNLDRFAATVKNLATLANMFPAPLKIPLAESANRGMETMSLQRNSPIYGIPPVIGEILTNNPNGLTSMQVLDELKSRKIIPAHRPRMSATQQLTHMQDRGWVEKIGGSRTAGGPLWRLTGAPIEYSAHGEVKRKKKLAKELRKLRKTVNGKGAAAVAAPKKGKVTDQFGIARAALSEARRAIEICEKHIDAVESAAAGVLQREALLDAAEVKLQQRQKALETAKKLLAGI